MQAGTSIRFILALVIICVTAIRLQILWPSGAIDTVEAIKANQTVTVTEGQGITRQEQFRRAP